MKNILDSYIREGYRYKVEKAVMTKETGALTLYIRLNFIVPAEDIGRIEEAIKKGIPAVSQTDIRFIYEDVRLDRTDIFDRFIGHMIRMSNGRYSAVTKMIYPHEFREEEGYLTIYALGETAVRTLNSQVASEFQKMLKDNFDIDIKVGFKNHEDEYARTSIDIESRGEEFSKKPEPKQTKTVNKTKRNGKQEAIMGKAIKEPVMAIGDLPETGEAVIEGKVFEITEKTVRNGKKLINILLYDGTTSACAKAFMKEEKWNEMSEKLRENDLLKIKGDIEWDNFTNNIVIMAKHIEKGNQTKREDLSGTKRIELHAHTKMSAMDGFNDIRGMIEQAASWGHRAIAITDHGVVQAFPEAFKAAADLKKQKGQEIKIIYGLEGYIFDDSDCLLPDGKIDYRSKKTNHVIILAKDQNGLKNLYRLVSDSHIKYFYRKPRIPKSLLSARREGLIIGSACAQGEVYQAVLRKYTKEKIDETVDFYDYLEIQPLINNQFLIDGGLVSGKEELKDINRRIIELGREHGKTVVATCDTHYTSPDDFLYRKILMAGQGYKDTEGEQGLYLRTTGEMLSEFDYLDEETASDLVIKGPGYISDMIAEVMPVPSGKFPPKIQDADEILRRKCEENAKERYGDPLPDKIRERLFAELDSIIGNDYAVLYVSAEKLVQKSLSDGYLVGSRGSVGSSFAATMAGITEVNPLPPHYICPACKKLEWGDETVYDCGADMPVIKCSNCNAVMEQDGFNIPFETFLGFEGNKEPDIDLNFAGEYQARAHKFVEEIFGSENVFRAGTISTIASKTAYGFVMKYFEERGIPVNKYEAERLTKCCTGIRRTTGQHPGGIIILPKGHDIHEFCPVQYPANDSSTGVVTTHFEYHAIDKNLFKLDILGHDNPSMIRQLQDMTGVDPLKVSLKDEKVMSLFNGIDSLDVKEPDYRFTHGSFGVPEFGTRFVRQMLDDTKPDKFADLVRISGFSHGTNVWINNAQEYIRSGQATLKDAISTRDDIMNYLIQKGLSGKDAFEIMERVRKGKGVSDDQEDLMRGANVPSWYIESCRRITYMFPKAHAVAYVVMSFRIAYYKVYHPAQFYAVYFTTKVADFNWDVIKNGAEACLRRIDSLELKGKNMTKKEEDEVTVLEVAYEMYSRGYNFTDPVLGESKAVKFTIKEGAVQIPLCALLGVGENAGRAIEEEWEKKPFETIDEMRERTRINKTAIESLRSNGTLDGMPESDQLSLF